MFFFLRGGEVLYKEIPKRSPEKVGLGVRFLSIVVPFLVNQVCGWDPVI